MAYTIEYIPHENGLIIQWTGVAKADEIIQSYHERYSPVERLKTLRYIITDYTHMDDFEMEPSDIKTIAEITNIATESNRDIYAAAVMPTDIAFGMARMFQSYADDDTTGWHTIVTRTRKEAEDWLHKNLDKNLTFTNSP